MTKTFEKESAALLAFDTEVTPGGSRKAMAEAGAKNPGLLWMVDADKIHIIPGYNPRIHDDKYEAHIENTTQSMMQIGWDPSKPLELLPDASGKLWLKDGHTRLTAYHRAVLLGLKPQPIPCVPCPKGTSMEDLTIGLVRSNSGKPLTSYEIGIVCKRLSTTYHHTPKEISVLLGISDKYVGQLLDLVAAPAQLRELVQSGQVTASLAIETMAKHKGEATAVLMAALGKAGGQGKKKATKKDTLTVEEIRVKRERQLSHRLFAAVELLLADKKIINVIDGEVYKEIDSILFARDQAPE